MARKNVYARDPRDFGYLGERVRKDHDYFLYTVSGRGHFPEDMLRYDRAEFADEESEKAGTDEARRDLRDIHIKAKGCTPERWRSFGWSVVPNVIEHRHQS